MRILIALVLSVALTRPVWAEPEMSQPDRVTMLEHISETLGSRAACGEQAVLQNDLPRYVFVLQIEKAADATKAATTGVQNGFANVQNNKPDCDKIKTDADAIDGQLRANPAITYKLMFDVSSAAGAALECNIPQDQVDHAVGLVKTWTGMTSDADTQQINQWIEQGRKIIQLKLYSCDQAKLVVTALPKYF